MHTVTNEIRLDEETRSPLTYEDLAGQIIKFEEGTCTLIFSKNADVNTDGKPFATAKATMNDDGLITLDIEPTSESMAGKRWICVIDQNGNLNGRFPKIIRKALEIISVTLITRFTSTKEGLRTSPDVNTTRVFNRQAGYRLSTSGILRQPSTN